MNDEDIVLDQENIERLEVLHEFRKKLRDKLIPFLNEVGAVESIDSDISIDKVESSDKSVKYVPRLNKITITFDSSAGKMS